MKNESTCCNSTQNETCKNDEPSTTSTVNFVQPEWNADRHDAGVDLEVTLPGVRKEDLDLVANAGQLTLTARRAVPSGSRRLIYGASAPEGYRLSLRLGNSLDGAGLKATLTDGVLKVAVPLLESAQPRKVEID